MRLDKFLTKTIGCTRSEAKLYIKKKRVVVNDKYVLKADVQINENSDVISFDNNILIYQEFEYYMLNKPAGVVSATTDKIDKTVISLIDSTNKDLFPVGRLDKDTEGLLLITNNGELAHELLSPKKHVNKTYYAKIQGVVTEDNVKAFNSGIKISEDFICLPAELEIIKSDTISEVYITIQEGKFHQIKRMFKAISMEVIFLKRLSMKNLVLDEKLQVGEYRVLTQDEINGLLAD